MENPFKQIDQPLKEVPQELKAKVMHDIALAKLFMELAELFSYNIGHIIDSVTSQRKK
ncbi:hypothetical protein HSX10_14820 [Winogradskyella undariae]|uniref:hypothetical protein n=1 Tax=Winogradskyella TaxID=286104 RepID=UPI00156B0B70|nr:MULTISPECIES: hypothetical protein [Winogradskyella]NRR92844.1 hypothetical protein [Winogradskyella undariae]QNK77800.1 hypothetical protein H7F37_01535 [Winogradskyella sp. PAMC22761]QXP79195.1 hypothetical protein H0I32_00650 [Winogradskyella sp. HaHa_3_26]